MNIRAGIGWLSSSSAEITRARGVLDALKKPGVIDELGFLMLNGAFAERFYPAVTTIMTRARYLIFIPAIYQHIEQSRKGVGRDVDKLSRDLQFDLSVALSKNEKSFIGREGGRSLIRVPSTVYWGALESLGIARRGLSESSYQRRLAEGAFGVQVSQDDDGARHDDESESLWDPLLRLAHVMPQGVFPQDSSFRLRRSEARLLEERYRGLKPGGNENLVSRMVVLGRALGAKSVEGLDYPWNVPDCAPDVARHVGHARLLSLLARGATLQYYTMLLEKKQDADPRVDDAFSDWWDVAADDLKRWDLPEFFALLRHWAVGRGKRDEDFMSSWIARVTGARSARAALADAEARRVIARREDAVRNGKQRLRLKHQLEAWSLPNDFGSTYYMNYRHRVGRQFAIDIVDGLVRDVQ
jgi:hypothetical protein